MNFISHGDFIFPNSLAAYFTEHFYLWSFASGGLNLDGVIRMFSRIPNLIVFGAADSIAAAYFYFFGTLVFAFISFYLFSKVILEENRKPVLIVTSMLFALNPIFLGNAAKIGLVLAVATLPLLFVCLHKFFKTDKVSFLFLALLLVNVSLIHPFTFIVNGLATCFYALFLLQKHGLTFNKVRKILLAITVGVLLNLYIFIPAFTLGTIEKDSLSNSVDQSATDYTALLSIANTKTIGTALSFSKDVLKDFDFYTDVGRLGYFLSAGILYIVVLFLLISNRKNIGRSQRALFWTTIIGFTATILLATAEVFGVLNVHKFLVNLPAGWAFRSPLKWQLYTPLFFALLALIGLRHKKHVWGPLLLISFLLLSLSNPVAQEVSTKLLSTKTTTILSQKLSASPNTKMLVVGMEECRIQFPEKYTEINSELNFASKSFRIRKDSVTENKLSSVNLRNYSHVISCFDIATPNTFFEPTNLQTNTFRLYTQQATESLVEASDNILLLDAAAVPATKRFLEHSEFTDYVTAPIDGVPAIDTFPFSQYFVPETGNVSIPIDSNKNYSLYEKSADNLLSIKRNNDSLFFFTSTSSGDHVPLEQVDLSPNSERIIEVNGEVFFDSDISDTNAQILGDIKQVANIYTKDIDNAVTNPDFTEGLWQENVGDCNNYDANPVIDMQLVSLEDNNKLALSSRRHLACTHQDISVEPGSLYLLAFTANSTHVNGIGYGLSFAQNRGLNYAEKISHDSNTDYEHGSLLLIPEGIDTVRINLYSYPLSTETENVTTTYDNLELKKLSKVDSVHGFRSDTFSVSTEISNTNTFTDSRFKNTFTGQNIVPGGSFEAALWQNRVSNCFKYDDSPVISMEHSTENSDGNKSLALSTQRHLACTSVSIPVRERTTYQLSFDHKNNLSEEVGYHIQFNDLKQSFLRDKITSTNTGWSNYKDTLVTPPNATEMTLTLYGYESDQNRVSTTHYDDVTLLEIPDIADNYFLVEKDPAIKENQGIQTSYTIVNPTKIEVTASNITDDFFLEFKEKYNKGWALKAQDTAILSSTHFPANEGTNIWHVSLAELCSTDITCNRINNEPFAINFTIEFMPQQRLNASLIVSVLTYIGVLLFLLYETHRSARKTD